MRRFARISAAFALLVLTAVSCCEKTEPFNGPYRRVMIYYGAGYNNLSKNLDDDVRDELLSGFVPGKNEDKALLVFSHNTRQNRADYSTPNAPSLVRAYKDGDILRLDTLKIYPDNAVSASAAMVREVLEDVSARFKSDHYGFVLSSHGTGWLPEGYYATGEDRQFSTSSIGAQFNGSSLDVTEIDIIGMASAIPFKLDYIVFDACLMGCAEVAMEFAAVCDRMVLSPAEILTDGMYYKSMSEHLLKEDVNLQGVCEDYYNYYKIKDSYATVTLVDCSGMTALANTVASIANAHRTAIRQLDRNGIQRFYRSGKDYFFDLKDILEQAGATPDELAALNSVLDDAVPYKAATEYFLPDWAGFKIEKYCGLSMYLPKPSYPKLNKYYKSLKWNEVTGLVE